jgi:hypothetical protein
MTQEKTLTEPNNIIQDPFKTIYDVTPQTPIDDIPQEYWKEGKQHLQDERTEAERLKEAVEAFSVNPDNEELLLEQAHTTISRFDDHIIRAVFHTGLSAYYKPLNLGLKAESGSGKTYSTVETIKFLPDEDVQFIGSQSPKVISHENGIRKSKDGRILGDPPKQPRRKDFEDPVFGEGDKERADYAEAKKLYAEQKTLYEADCKGSFYEVDLRNKIVLFLESVNLETFRMIKSTMSHDHDYIDHKYVDDKGSVHVTRLVGAPAMIFNSVDNEYVEEQATRTLTATPSNRAEKIEDAMRISCRKSAYPWLYDGEPFNQRVIKEYVRKIKQLMAAGKIQVAAPFDELVIEGFSKDAVRDMRDFNKYLELVPSYAIFKLFQRPIVMIAGKRYLIPTVKDAVDAKATFDSILETTKTSTDYRIIEFYHTIVAKHEHGHVTAEELADEYNEGRKRPLSVKRIREWLTRLEDIGYVDIREEMHENTKGIIDKRFNAYFPLKKNTPNTAIIKIDVDLKSILEKGFEKWLKNAPIQNDTTSIILNINGTAKLISETEIKAIVLGNKNSEGNRENIGPFLTAAPTSNNGNKLEIKAICEIAVNGTFSQYLIFEHIQRKPGVYCSASTKGGYDCGYEAEWNINGNLYCDCCFKEQAKFLQDNGTGLKLKGES